MSRTCGLTASKLALAITAAIALPAQAVDFDGYFRAGPGATSKGNARACYKLNGAGVSGAGTFYRLGNECDFYGEFGLNSGPWFTCLEMKSAIRLSSYSLNLSIQVQAVSAYLVSRSGYGETRTLIL